MENYKMEIYKIKNRIVGLKQKSLGRGLTDSECMEIRELRTRLNDLEQSQKEYINNITDPDAKRYANAMMY